MQTTDYVLYTVCFLMSLTLSGVSVIMFFSYKNGWILSKGDKFLLNLLPSLFYSLSVFLVLYLLGPITFSFFTETKSINNSVKIAVIVAFVWFLFEYAGNLRNVKEKTAEIESFLGSRNKNFNKEGFNHVPGILPLLAQVTIYTFFKFSIFADSIRSLNLSPVIFVESVIAYTKDSQAVVLSLNCKFKIVDPHEFDDSLNDNAKDEDGRRAPVITSAKEFIAKIINSVAVSNTLDDLRDDWKESFSSAVRRASKQTIDGLQIERISFRFVSFHNESLQNTFQSFAGRNIRRGDIGAKSEEVVAILKSLKEIDPSYERSDAERLWETFTKDERGVYGFRFF